MTTVYQREKGFRCENHLSGNLGYNNNTEETGVTGIHNETIDAVTTRHQYWAYRRGFLSETFRPRKRRHQKDDSNLIRKCYLGGTGPIPHERVGLPRCGTQRVVHQRGSTTRRWAIHAPC